MRELFTKELGTTAELYIIAKWLFIGVVLAGIAETTIGGI